MKKVVKYRWLPRIAVMVDQFKNDNFGEFVSVGLIFCMSLAYNNTVHNLKVFLKVAYKLHAMYRIFFLFFSYSFLV